MLSTRHPIDIQKAPPVRYSLVDGERTEALPRLNGVCQCCGGQTIAKCGQHVVWHWAHKRREDCDPWWESETEWHRSWKDRFPLDWQEVVHCDHATGEKHIADVKTPHRLVVEIQNSPIHPEEMRSRENFYSKLVWIVNGNRRGVDGRSQTLDRSYFNMGRSSDPICHDPLAFPVEWLGKSKLVHNWSKSSAVVYFDFGDGILWRLDSFEPDKTIFFEDPISASSNSNSQGELFAPTEKIEKKQRKINLGVFTPIRIEDFVECSKRGRPVQGGFGLEDLGIFRKELAIVDAVGGLVPDNT